MAPASAISWTASASVEAWIAEQNRLTRKYLDAIPQRPEIKRRVERLRFEQTVYRYGFQYRSALFALKTLPPANQPFLVVLPPDGDTAKERVVLDPGKLDPRGRTTIDFYKASYDGKHVIVSLSDDQLGMPGPVAPVPGN